MVLHNYISYADTRKDNADDIDLMWQQTQILAKKIDIVDPAEQIEYFTIIPNLHFRPEFKSGQLNQNISRQKCVQWEWNPEPLLI